MVGREGGREGTYLVADNEEGFPMSLHLDDDGLQAGDHVQVGFAPVGGGREGGREGGKEGGWVEGVETEKTHT